MRNLTVFFAFLVLASCTSKITEINKDEYLLKGDFKFSDNDTLYEGMVEVFNKQNVKVASSNYKNNLYHGDYISYFTNGKIKQEAHYVFGKQNGESKIFDSSQSLLYKNFYYNGREIGGTYNYNKDSIKVYRFFSFDGWELYSCKYEISNKDTLLESGGLLNYTTNYKEIDGEMQIEVFLYLINPPHKKISYKILDVDKSGIVPVIQLWQMNSSLSSDQFSVIHLDLPRENHKYVFELDAYYPKENVTLTNLKENEKDLRMPVRR